MRDAPASDSVICTVLTAYPLDGAAPVHKFAATRNEIWLVEDAARRRFVLRRNLQHANIERIAFQVRFQQHLRERGVPAAEVVATRSGEALVVDDAGVPWVLCTYVDGEEFDFAREGQVREAAQRLAQFHEVAETFEGRAPRLDYQEPYRTWWARADENLRELNSIYAGRPVQEELTYVRDWWAWVLAEWPLERVDALPTGWVYGDYHGRNMLFAGDEVRGLFDFDDVERGPLVYDVAHGVFMFGRERRGSRTIRADVARAFVRSYSQRRTLTDEERAALPMMIAMSFPPNAAYHRYCRDQRSEDLEPRLRREVGLMRDLRVEMDRIGSTLQDA